MNFAFLDASALGKRYLAEPGSPSIHHLFTKLPLAQMIVFNVGLAEVVSILVRKRNNGRLTGTGFPAALNAFLTEMVLAGAIRTVAADDALVSQALTLIQVHSLNGTDAILLRSALDLAHTARASGHNLLLVAADQRLLNAARLEGLAVFNPETQAPADLDALLGP